LVALPNTRGIEIFTAGRTFFPLITPVCRLPPPAGLFDSII
jgi:hypothetical protein